MSEAKESVGSNTGRDRSSMRRMILLILVSCCAGYSLVINVWRMTFPYDLYIWSESAFLTNILKIEDGVNFYTARADANSFVYSPGLEYIGYYLLKPFHLELNLVAHRFINVIYGIAACVLGACAILRLYLKLGVVTKKDAPWVLWMTGIGTLLLMSRGVSFGVMHPDNLHALAFAGAFFFSVTGLVRQQSGWFIAAMVLGAIAIFAKQTAATLIFAPTLGAIFGLRVNVRHKIGLIALAACLLLLSLTCLWLLPQSKFYTFDLLSRQGIDYRKMGDVIIYFFRLENLLPLFLAALVLLWCHWKCRIEVLFLVIFVLLGAGPSSLGYLKVLGIENNLGLIKLSLALISFPLLFEMAVKPGQTLLFAAAISLILLQVPKFYPPNRETYRFAAEMQGAVDEAKAKHERILVCFGSVVLIKAGLTEVPLDRANSISELRVGRLTDFPATLDRINSKYYDTILWNCPDWYGSDITAAIARNYHSVSTIRAVNFTTGFVVGFQRELTEPVVVMKKND
jgi:hypothetical protein